MGKNSVSKIFNVEEKHLNKKISVQDYIINI